MNPEKIWAVSRKVLRFTKEHAKYAGFSLLVACAPQSEKQQVIYREVTATPTTTSQEITSTPENATTTPIPVTSTPELPPATATPQLESPFPKNTTFSGDMQEIGKHGLRGRSMFWVTDEGALLWRYDIKRTCGNDKETTALNIHLIPPSNFHNRTAVGPGFEYTVRGIAEINGLLFKDGTLRTNFKFKEFPPLQCPSVDFVSVGTNQGTDPEVFMQEYNKNRAAIRLASLVSLPEVWEDIRGQCSSCLKTKGK